MILVWASPFNNHLVSMVSNDIRSCMDKVYVELGMEVWQERQSQQKGYASPITWLLVRCILRFCSQLKKTPSLDPSVAGPIETPWPCLLLIMILTAPSRQRLADYPPPPAPSRGWLTIRITIMILISLWIARLYCGSQSKVTTRNIYHM